MITRYDFTDLTNPFGCHEAVKKVMSESLEKVNFYPEEAYQELKFKLTQELNVDEDNLTITAGAAEGIFSLPQALKPRQAGIIQPTFNYYRPAVIAVNSNVVDILLNKDFSLPLPKIKSVIGDLDLLFICNPNHPTSNTYPVGELVEIIEKAQENDCFVIFDEVYIDFADDSDKKTVKDLVAQYSNIAVLGSFSKTLAIPGLRVGYILCNGELISTIEEQRQPWPVNVVGLNAVLASFAEKEFLKETLRKTSVAREIFIQELKSLGLFQVFKSDSNFIMVKTLARGQGKMINEKLIEQGIMVHSLEDHLGLSGDYFQIGVRKSSENGMLIDALKAIIGEERLVA